MTLSLRKLQGKSKGWNLFVFCFCFCHENNNFRCLTPQRCVGVHEEMLALCCDDMYLKVHFRMYDLLFFCRRRYSVCTGYYITFKDLAIFTSQCWKFSFENCMRGNVLPQIFFHFGNRGIVSASEYLAFQMRTSHPSWRIISVAVACHGNTETM